jgi:hypothetical protein
MSKGSSIPRIISPKMMQPPAEHRDRISRSHLTCGFAAVPAGSRERVPGTPYLTSLSGFQAAGSRDTIFNFSVPRLNKTNVGHRVFAARRRASSHGIVAIREAAINPFDSPAPFDEAQGRGSPFGGLMAPSTVEGLRVDPEQRPELSIVGPSNGSSPRLHFSIRLCDCGATVRRDAARGRSYLTIVK